MAENRGVWGIDIGQAGLKALRLKYAEAANQVLAVAFDYIPYPKILSQPDAIPDQLIGEALDKFLSRNDLKGDGVAIAVPGQTALTRFIQLPPVEQSKIAEIVKYEARQQIPFALEDVCWQWQVLGGGTEESGFMLEAEVGLFAMKREQVMQHLKPFTDRQVEVDLIQIAPLALYNFLSFDRLGIRPGEAKSSDSYTIILDMGADNTMLLVSNGVKIWIRNVPIGGNHFTRALTKEMKLTFAKAEHLKCNATKSPDPKAVFQALRPVFNDYVSEIQRSIGYFSSVNRDAKVEKVIGLGNGFKLAGLQKFLQQNLQYEVERVDSFQALAGDSVVRAPLFEENLMGFAVPYGLALQGLELTRIHVDLLPGEIRTARKIREKKPWAVAAAAMLLVGLAIPAAGLARVYNSVRPERFDPAIQASKDAAGTASQLKSAYTSEEGKFQEEEGKVEQLIKPAEDRLQWLELYRAINECLPRDPVDAQADKDITKKNRMKIWSVTAKKLPDVATWFQGLQANEGIMSFMSPVDKANAPSGPGYVFTLQGAHYHKDDSDYGSGRGWVQATFLKNLQEMEYKNPAGGDHPVPVRLLGITHPVIVRDKVTPIQYVLDPSKLKAGRKLHGQEINPSFRGGIGGESGYPGAGGYPMGDLGGTEEYGPGGGIGAGGYPGIGGTGGQGLDFGKKKKTGDEKETGIKTVEMTEFTVEFVWQPPSPEEREAWKRLYHFFTENPEGTFDQAKQYVEDAEKWPGPQILLEQQQFDNYVSKHREPPEGGAAAGGTAF